jgi:hypothetical protein
MRIAFVGRMGSGKTTAATEAAKLYDGKVVKIAEPLYNAAIAVYAILGMNWEKDGRLLQLLGTEWGRNIHEDFWVDKFRVKWLSSTEHLFCDDLRFPNEEYILRELMGFKIIRIDRRYHTFTDEQLDTIALGRDLTHPSEMQTDSLRHDLIVRNDRSESEFKMEVVRAIEYLYPGRTSIIHGEDAQ